MVDASRFRLDTADRAIAAGWEVADSVNADEFTTGDTTIEVQYCLDDGIESLVRRGPNSRYEAVPQGASGMPGMLRSWLEGAGTSHSRPTRTTTARKPDFTQRRGDWTREEFEAAVVVPTDRAFLLRIFELVDGNRRQLSAGVAPRLYFGRRPGGAVYIYPFGRRYPPLKIRISKRGALVITGCWNVFPEIKGHPGFARLASMLDLHEKGPERWVPVAGFDPEDVWNTGEIVSRLINE